MLRSALFCATVLSTVAFPTTPPALAQVTNAPIAPDTIYVWRQGPSAGLSVIDLNGFGAGTGNPAFDFTYQTFSEGNSNYPNNPNVKLQGNLLVPPLIPGTSTLNGGSAGVFTLTKNSALEDLVLRAPSIASVGDMMLGRSLDLSFNNAPAGAGCQVGGGNLCLLFSLQRIEVGLGGDGSLVPAIFGGAPIHSAWNEGNAISWAPHPNPPPLSDPPACLVPWIGAQEPTSVVSGLPAPQGAGLPNLLAPGDPLGDPTNGIPPSGLLAPVQNSFFVGASPQQQTIAACLPYMIRQQIGHFLYLADTERGEVVAVNSNTMRVLARIPLADPTEFAMSPNLNLLAVTQRSSDQVSFLDIDPRSSTFHQVVATTAVGDAPAGIAWDPGNEDVLVCNEGSNSVSILSTLTLAVRKTVRRGLDRPFGIAITQRQTNFGFHRNVYFAYILDRSGHVSLFESGPDGVNGWGYDDIVWRSEFAFAQPRAIQPDPVDLRSGVWIAHQGQLASNGTPTGLGGGAVSNLVIDSGIVGQIPLVPGEAPHLRDLVLRVVRSIGSDQLSGIPLDVAFDDQRNFGALPGTSSVFASGTPIVINSKSQVRAVPGYGVSATNQASFLFVPVRRSPAGSEAVDVLRLSNGSRVDTNAYHAGTQSIPASGAAVVMDYFRQ
jgi:YVTN family beta-propeller protein